MIQRDYLIIGAGVGGASVCAEIRKYDKRGSVMLVGAESLGPYHRPQLFKTFLGKSPAPAIPAKLLHSNPEWYVKNKIDLRLETAVTQFNLERRLAVLGTGQAVEFRKACLATGSRARRPVVAGANLGNVIYIRTIRDVLALREICDSEKGIVVIGGGLIAIETAALLRQMKINVTLMTRFQQIWQQRVDLDTAEWLTGLFAGHGVTLMAQESLNGFEGKTVLRNIQTKSGERFPAGMALVAIGAEPNLDLVLNTPLSSPGGTPVNEYLETDEKGIYAVGDVALYPDRIFGGMRRTEHWENAIKQGEVIGGNITGKRRQKYECVPWHASEIFDLKFDFVGDFRMAPTRVEFEGDRKKKKFVARYFQGGPLMGILGCNQGESFVESARTRLREAHPGGR